MAGQGMFRRLHNSERKRILQAVGPHRTLITVKGTQDDEVYNLMAGPWVEDKNLHCRAGSVGRLPSKDQNVVVNFIFGFERYFCEGRMRIESGVAIIDMNENLYVLQRRKSVRMNIPDKYPASFNCINLKGKPVLLDMKVLDFSSGGVRAHFAKFDPVFKAGDPFKAVLHLGQRRPMELNVTVRHVIQRTSGNNPGQILGIQFDLQSKTLETKLLTIFMDLHRELFVKYG